MKKLIFVCIQLTLITLIVGCDASNKNNDNYQDPRKLPRFVEQPRQELYDFNFGETPNAYSDAAAAQALAAYNNISYEQALKEIQAERKTKKTYNTEQYTEDLESEIDELKKKIEDLENKEIE